MSIIRGDFVRPNNPSLGLPRGSVWRVDCTAGGLKLEPENNGAQGARLDALGCRYPEYNFDKVVLCRGQWVDVRDADFLRRPSSFYDDVLTGRMSSAAPSPQNLPKPLFSSSFPSPQNLPKSLFSSADAVTTATVAAEQASDAVAAIDNLRESVRKLEAQRQQELREAKAAKAKADKEAAAKAKVREARQALAAKLHADRCLGEATLALIAEVARLNNGGAERPADSSIAAHCGQLQPLARSYGYRIAKPSMIALVVKL